MNFWAIDFLPVDIDIKHYIKQLYVKEQFCYECQDYLSSEQVQVKACSQCHGRLCKRHGGDFLYTCCMLNLCIHCYLANDCDCC